MGERSREEEDKKERLPKTQKINVFSNLYRNVLSGVIRQCGLFWADRCTRGCAVSMGKGDAAAQP